MIAAGSRMSVPPGAPTKATPLPRFHSVCVRSVQTHLTPGPKNSKLLSWTYFDSIHGLRESCRWRRIGRCGSARKVRFLEASAATPEFANSIQKWNQTPSHNAQFTLTRLTVLPYHGLQTLRSNVVRRRKVRVIKNVRVAGLPGAHLLLLLLALTTRLGCPSIRTKALPILRAFCEGWATTNPKTAITPSQP